MAIEAGKQQARPWRRAAWKERHLVEATGVGALLIAAAHTAPAIAAQCNEARETAALACSGSLAAGLVACMALGACTGTRVAAQEWGRRD